VSHATSCLAFHCFLFFCFPKARNSSSRRARSGGAIHRRRPSGLGFRVYPNPSPDQSSQQRASERRRRGLLLRQEACNQRLHPRSKRRRRAATFRAHVHDRTQGASFERRPWHSAVFCICCCSNCLHHAARSHRELRRCGSGPGVCWLANGLFFKSLQCWMAL